MDKKIKIGILAVIIAMVVFIAGVFVGGKSVEIDINKRVNNGEIFATTASLDKNKTGDVKNDKGISAQLEQANENCKNEIYGLEQAANEIIDPLIKKNIGDIKLYFQLKNKNGDEFLSADFADGWDDGYKSEHSAEIADAKKLREKIMSGPIFFQDIYGQRVYYAPNYFKWTKEKIESITNSFCDGAGCKSLTTISAGRDNIFWFNQYPCKGGAGLSDPQQEFYREYKCELLNEAIQ